jgi:PilZ domain
MVKEKRVARRKLLRYTAWVALTAEQRHGCVVSEVSDTGARLDVQDSTVLPDHFVLLLTNTGVARRYCRVMWRKATQVGVKFARSLAEAETGISASKSKAAAAEAKPAATEPAESA